MTDGLYKDLFEKIATAQEELLKHCVEANTVIINGRRYAKLAHEVELCCFGFTPMIFGLAVETSNALPDDWEFIVQHRTYPPTSEYEKLVKENRALKEKLAKLRALLGEEPT